MNSIYPYFNCVLSGSRLVETWILIFHYHRMIKVQFQLFALDRVTVFAFGRLFGLAMLPLWNVFPTFFSHLCIIPLFWLLMFTWWPLLLDFHFPKNFNDRLVENHSSLPRLFLTWERGCRSWIPWAPTHMLLSLIFLSKAYMPPLLSKSFYGR